MRFSDGFDTKPYPICPVTNTQIFTHYDIHSYFAIIASHLPLKPRNALCRYTHHIAVSWHLPSLPFFAARALDWFRGRKVLENLSFQNDERIAALELSLQEAQMIAEDSDRKYDEVKNGKKVTNGCLCFFVSCIRKCIWNFDECKTRRGVKQLPCLTTEWAHC